jgi:magnesium chelatase family protein
MLSKVFTCAIMGIDGLIIEVETDVSNGLPGFSIVGLPDTAVRESRERVRTSIKNSDYEYPVKKVTVNLAPADVKKEGPCYDLSIAIGILSATGQIRCSNLCEYIILGELSLDGRVKPVDGVLCMAVEALKKGFKNIIVPYRNADEAVVINNLHVYPVSTLKEAIEVLEDGDFGPYCRPNSESQGVRVPIEDFIDIKGQEGAKRAMEIAAAGGHNVLMIGPPGSGKTMLARRLSGILPEMTIDEAIEISKIYSISGKLENGGGIIYNRPFRSPHHTISAVSLVGGGRIPKPGEVSLSHYGVLFLDELPEFQRHALEVLRQPMEDGKVCISRVNGTLTFPSVFMLIASMNPCPCGFYNDPVRECTCTEIAIRKYLSKISGPLLDRIDIHIEVSPVKFDELESDRGGERSADIRKRVNRSRYIQIRRYEKEGIICNSQLTSGMIKKYCGLTEDGKKLMRQAFEKLGLSARAYNRVLKIARTIADIEEEEKINVDNVAEAIQYRNLDRKYWDR